MSPETFSHLLKQLQEVRPRSIRVIGAGEPTLHKRFSEWLPQLRPLAPFTSVTTNGQRLTEDTCRAVLTALDVIEISVASNNATGYESSRAGGHFGTLLCNLRRLQDLKTKAKSKTLIHVRVMLRPSERVETSRIIKFWSPFGDIVSTQLLKDYFCAHGDLYPLGEPQENYPRCVKPFKHTGVNWNGDVPLCDGSAYQLRPRGLVLGNINSEALPSIWRSDLINQYRKGHKEGHTELTPICRGCPDALNPRVWRKVYNTGEYLARTKTRPFRILK